MSELHSTRWHRVAGLRPLLSAQVRLQRQRVRGETWYLLANASSGRSVRLNAAAHALAGRFDGQRSVQELWEKTLARGTESATQDEVIDLLAHLREAGLVQFDRPADFELLLPHLEQTARPRGGGSLLAWRFPLLDPSRLLHRLRAAQCVFSGPGLLLWALAVGWLVLLALQNAGPLWAFGSLWMATPRFALLALLLYLPIKLMHELAHGLAVARWGGRVHEAGVTLMLLMPVPYMNASAASAFVQRRHRIAVAAAGIMAELALAAIALPLWLWLDDGLLRDAMFVTLVVTSVSTLLFNANPLQRLDGYYIATDALELPNLGPRSRAWWMSTLRRWLLALPGSEQMPVARGEAFWLALYAPLAWLYGGLIAALATAWLGHLSLALGLLCGALLTWQMVLRPPWRVMSQLRRAALGQTRGARRWRVTALGATTLLLLLLVAPWPERTLVQGVVWPPEQAQVRSEEDGQVEAVHARDGQAVESGAIVLQLSNPALQSSLERQRARVGALEAGLFDALPSGGAPAGDKRAELLAAQAELDRLTERVAALTVRAHAAGRLALPGTADLLGEYVKRGALLGQVLTGLPATVRMALPEAEAKQLRAASGLASVRLAASPQIARAAQLTRDSVGAGLQLPSAALSARHGGGVATDPRDASDLRPLQPVVLLDVRLQPGSGARAAPSSERIGERAWVRFDGGWTPLVVQAARALRQQVLRAFNPQF